MVDAEQGDAVLVADGLPAALQIVHDDGLDGLLHGRGHIDVPLRQPREFDFQVDAIPHRPLGQRLEPWLRQGQQPGLQSRVVAQIARHPIAEFDRQGMLFAKRCQDRLLDPLQGHPASGPQCPRKCQYLLLKQFRCFPVAAQQQRESRHKSQGHGHDRSDKNAHKNTLNKACSSADGKPHTVQMTAYAAAESMGVSATAVWTVSTAALSFFNSRWNKPFTCFGSKSNKVPPDSKCLMNTSPTA